MKKFLIGLFLLALLPIVSTAQVDREVRRSVKIYFRQGSAVIDENYMDNRATLQSFASEVKTYCEDSTAKFRRIRIIGSASPEGSQRINDHLSRARAKAIAEWIGREISVELGYDVVRNHIDWDELTRLVEATPEVPYREEVLHILRTIPERIGRGGAIYNERYNQLVALRKGVPYRYLETKLFPRLRYAAARAEFWWEEEPATLEIATKDVMRFAADGGEGVVAFKKNKPDGILPTATTEASWITALTPTVSNLSFAVEPNMSKEPRTANIEVACYGATHKVVVHQAGREPHFDITSPSPINVPAEGAKSAITFKHNIIEKTAPAVKSQSDWVTLAEPTADSVAFTVAPNKVKSPRSTNISVECYGKQYDVVVNQEAAAKKPFYMSLRSNMLYDIAGVPNIGAEFYLGKNLSLAANWGYAWWGGPRTHIYWRYYGGDLALRWWFGKASKVKPLQGHHIGAYGHIFTYDFSFGKKGVIGGTPGGDIFAKDDNGFPSMQKIIGLEYGYSLPVAPRLNIDFTVGVGYYWGVLYKYETVNNLYLGGNPTKFAYMGPTKLEISLVWQLGRENYNEHKKKGGKR